MTANDLLGSVLVYLGLLAAILGAFACLRPVRCLRLSTRRRGATLLGVGLLLVALGMAIPAPLRHSAGTTQLDRILPDYQFSEFHEMPVRASTAAIHRAIWQVTAREIHLFRAFTWIRSPHLPGRQRAETILSAPADKPILTVATSSGFRLLSDQEGEVVVAAAVIAPPGIRASGDLRKIPGLALAVMSFRVEPLGATRCRLTTETRIFATDRSAFLRFKMYWRLIAPGSAILRGEWLRAIRERAERQPAVG